MVLRPAGPADEAALTDALLHAANWDGQVRFTRDQVLGDPHMSHYVAGWPRPGDFGTVAVDADVPIGAAWCRVFDSTDPGYGYVADHVPELSIGVRPGYRGRGIGTALMTAVMTAAVARGHHAVSLSVEDGNRARALYARFGFVVVGRNGGSDTFMAEP